MAIKIRTYLWPTVDEEFENLTGPGSLNDRIFSYLGGLGHTGSLSDRLYSFFNSTATPATILTVVPGTFSSGAIPITVTANDATNGDTVYWVLVPVGDTNPTATEIQNGQASGGGSPTASGSWTWPGPFSASLPDEIARANYKVGVVIYNGATSNAVISTGVEVDTTSAVLSSVSFADDSANGIDWAFTSDEAVTYRVSYWADGTDPSDSAIESGTGSIASVTGSAAASVAETGNFASTGAGTYQPTIYAVDIYGNETFSTVSDVTVAVSLHSFSDPFTAYTDEDLAEDEAVYTSVFQSGTKISIRSGVAHIPDGNFGTQYLTYDGATLTDDQYSECVVADVGGASPNPQGIIYLFARYTDNSNYYAVEIRTTSSGTAIRLKKVVAGSTTYLFTTGTATNGDTVALEVEGTTLRVKQNASTIHTSTSESDHSSGKAGWGINQSGGSSDWLQIDDFNCGDI